MNPAIKTKDGRQLYPAKSLHRRIKATGSKIARGGGGDEGSSDWVTTLI